MPTYGLSTEGFLAKTLDIIRDDIGAALQAAFGASIRLDDQSILGQLVGIIAERMAILWELAEVVQGSQDPDAASGAALEQLALLTGTLRPVATHSAVVLTLTGVPTTVINAGSKVKTASTDIEFETQANATLVAVTPWGTSTPYIVGNRVTANSNVYQCSVAGTSLGSGSGPTLVPPFPAGAPPQEQNAILDNTVNWIFVGVGTAAADVLGAAVDTGVIAAAAYDISVIVNSLNGWDGVCNLDDANPGRAIATDAELRLLREQELATGGSSPINALRAELLRIANVIAVTIFENVTDIIDADGVPPHSIEALVRGPVSPDAAFDQSIFDALLAGVAAGIRTHGSTVGSATDDQGTVHVMKFSRPTNVPIYVTITVIKDPDEYPIDGDAQIKAAIVAYGDLQNTGKNAVASRIAAAAFTVTGVLDVVTCFIDDAPVPLTEATVDISLRQLATYSTTNISVISSDGVA